MNNVLYAREITAESLGKYERGQVLKEFLEQVAPKRPQFKFVVANYTMCHVYNGVADMTCTDVKSVHYVGCIGIPGTSSRGGKGCRYTLKVIPAGRSRAAFPETVSIPKAVSIFLKNCRVREVLSVVDQAVGEAAHVIGGQRRMHKHKIVNGVQAMLNSLSDMELATCVPTMLHAYGVPDTIPANDAEVAAEQLHALCTVFGGNNEHAAYVVQIGDNYVVRHGEETTSYVSETLPHHIACALGMLKIAGAEGKFLPGYGVLVSKGVYAVSIKEVTV